ncbi:MAG: hypothetical protein KDJ73_06230 [Notoacmeibacter sp.]|nr:hypothetical protein [Notoacmeibacter sp.]MCC0032852.1 hypothetical protein [Brucellaceae bacterium]
MSEFNRQASPLPSVTFPVILWRGLLMAGIFGLLALWFAHGARRALLNPVLVKVEAFRLRGLDTGMNSMGGSPRGFDKAIDAPLDEMARMLPGNLALIAFAVLALLCGWAALAFVRMTLSGRPVLTIALDGITAQGTGMKPKTIPWHLFDGTVNINGQFQILSKERSWLFLRDRANVPLFLIGERAVKLEKLLTTYRNAVAALGIVSPAERNQAARANPVRAAAPAAAPSLVSRSGIRFAGSLTQAVPATPRKSPHEIRRRV